MTAHSAPEGASEFRGFGWHGVNVTVPAHWQLVFTEGKRRAGYVRLADADQLRLELRWEAGPGRPPAESVDAYLAKLRKRAARQSVEFSVQRELNLASPPGKDVETYRWVADRQSVAMLSRCRKCERTVHLHVLGDADERLKTTARTVFASLRDHLEDGWDEWDFYDMRFRAPAGWAALRTSLQSGAIRMTFGKRLTRLRFLRLSLARILLAGRPVRDWLPEFLADALKRRSFRVRAERVKGHPAAHLCGRPWLLVNPLRLVGKKRVTLATAWHCEETNRLMVCAFDGPEGDAEVFETAVQGFECCPAGEVRQ